MTDSNIEPKKKRVKSLEDIALEQLQIKPLTYKELSRIVYGDGEYGNIVGAYGIVSRLRKKGHIFYPIFGEGTELKIPSSKNEANHLIDYVSRRSFGVVRSYVRTLNFLTGKFSVHEEVQNNFDKIKRLTLD